MTLAQLYITGREMIWELDPGAFWDQIEDITITSFTDGSVSYSDPGDTSTGRDCAVWWGIGPAGLSY